HPRHALEVKHPPRGEFDWNRGYRQRNTQRIDLVLEDEDAFAGLLESPRAEVKEEMARTDARTGAVDGKRRVSEDGIEGLTGREIHPAERRIGGNRRLVG